MENNSSDSQKSTINNMNNTEHTAKTTNTLQQQNHFHYSFNIEGIQRLSFILCGVFVLFGVIDIFKLVYYSSQEYYEYFVYNSLIHTISFAGCFITASILGALAVYLTIKIDESKNN